MWLSKRAANREEAHFADSGMVTISGDNPGVYTRLEKRGLMVYAPGGYIWRPRTGDEMLILKCDDDNSIVLGEPLLSYPEEMKSGEVYIKSENGASLMLKNDGSIQISGAVDIQGSLTVNGNEVT